MIIYFNSSVFNEIFKIINEKFNSNLIFINEKIEKIDYYIEYNNIQTKDDKYLNIINFKEDNYHNHKNVLNLHDYLYILDCNLDNINEKYENLVYISYVIYNFIIINTKLIINKPIVLDPISTIKLLLNKKSSLVRFGDGEIRYMHDSFINYGNSVQKYIDPVIMKKSLIENINNTSIISCIPDAYYDEYYNTCFDKNKKNIITNQNGKNMGIEYYNKFVLKDYIYGSCFIGRIYGYKNINNDKYISFYINKFIKNKDNIIICSREEYKFFLNKYYFSSNNNIIIICPRLINDEYSFDIINYTNKILKLCCSFKYENIYLHFGIYSKYISYILQKHNINTIDAGTFNINFKLDKDFIYDINNVLSILNYYIYHNNVIKYNINSNNDVLDENEPLIININEILTENNKLNSYMQCFGIKFNIEAISKHYINSVVKGKLKVKSNLPLKIFNGKNWLNINVKNYDNDLEIHNINKWRISPSNEYLSENMGSKNIEFIIYYIEFKINEIIE